MNLYSITGAEAARRRPRLPRTVCAAVAGLLALAMACSQPAAAEDSYHQPNDFGDVGLLQTPSAYFSKAGEFRFGRSWADPYRSWNFSVQPYDWFEASYRYVEFTNEAYGASDNYLDKNFNFKFRLVEEAGWIPQLALGFIDLGGTGLLASEYVVASKRINDFELTLGLGWGRLGARGGIDNPFTWVSDRYDEPREVQAAGDFTLDSLFKGSEIAPFGGVRWAPLGKPYSITLEREGNDYQSEPFGNNLDVDWPVNIGANYRWKSLDLGVAYERGNQLTFRVTVGGNLATAAEPPKTLDPAKTAVAPDAASAASPAATLAPNQSGFVDTLQAALQRQQITLRAVDFDPAAGKISIWFSQNKYRKEVAALSRVARSAAALAPLEYQQLTLISLNGDLEAYRATVDRETVRQVASGNAEVDELNGSTSFAPPEPRRANVDFDGLTDYPEAAWRISPATRQSLGDPNNFIYAQLWLALSARVQLSERLDVRGTLGADIVNNFDSIDRESDSLLPHVRSDIARYLDEGDTGLVSLYGNYIWPLSADWYARLSAGIFEQMYAGVAGELLYRPFGRDWALGLDVNRVRQRDYDQRFDFLDYEVSTGHATLYYEFSPLDMLVKLSGGRYLAGDEGATLDISRRFKTGVVVGAFATKTNVSAEEFGEGTFDKGFYISIPLDMLIRRSTKRQVGFAFRPLSRDGGQRVFDGTPLYGATSDSNLNDIAQDWADWGR